MSIGISADSQNVAVVSLAILYGSSLVAAAILLKRKATFAQLIPAAAISVTQALWFSVPQLARHFGLFGQFEPLSVQNAAYMLFWVGIGHSIQYLWITTYFAERAEHPTKRIPFYIKTMLAGAAIFSIPMFLFAPSIMGRLPLDGGLIILISSAVNLHHYLLDAVIWKLRQGRIADVLIRNEAAKRAEPEPEAGWFRPVLVGVGVLSFVVLGVEVSSNELAIRAAKRGDGAALSGWIDSLALIHHERAGFYDSLSKIQLRQGDLTEAVESAEHAHRLLEGYRYRSNLCRLYAAADRTSDAIEVCRPIVTNQPYDSKASMNLALLLARDPERTAATLDEAVALAEAAVAKKGDNPYFLEQLASIYGTADRVDEMQRVAGRALEKAAAREDQALAERLQAMVAGHRVGTETE
jgi:tetratricopeptide (TPR) repeat protein